METIMKLVSPILLLVCGLLFVPPVGAQTRNWLKYHERLEHDGVFFGEYTVIMTYDQISPQIRRVLWKDATGAKLVFRRDVTLSGQEVTSSARSVSTVDNSESVIIDVDDSNVVTVTLGTGSMQFTYADPLPQSVKDQAIQVLDENASGDFKDALRQLAKTGCYYAAELDGIGPLLRELFFESVIPERSLRDLSQDPTQVVNGFSPTTHGPSTFDEEFGAAYYDQ